MIEQRGAGLKTSSAFDAPSNKTAAGLLVPGNIINLYNRPVLNYANGSWGTTRSASFNINGKEVLLPTIINGIQLSNEQAVDRFYKTGQHLGMFDTPQNADAYAEQLHKSQESYGNFYGRNSTLLSK